jgi:hypothetical protein
MSTPKPPPDLKAHGRALHRRYHRAFELDEREADVIERVARLADLEAALVLAVDEHDDRRDRAQLLATTNLLCRLLSSLQLGDADDVKTPKQQRAGNAAATRWAAHNEIARKRKELGRG